MSLKSNLRTDMTALLKELRLPAVRACYGEEADRARREALPYERYLLEVMSRESEARRQHAVERLQRQSKLPLEKNLTSFDMERLPLRIRQQVKVLLDGLVAVVAFCVVSSILLEGNVPFNRGMAVFILMAMVINLGFRLNLQHYRALSIHDARWIMLGTLTFMGLRGIENRKIRKHQIENH